MMRINKWLIVNLAVVVALNVLICTQVFDFAGQSLAFLSPSLAFQQLKTTKKTQSLFSTDSNSNNLHQSEQVDSTELPSSFPVLTFPPETTTSSFTSPPNGDKDREYMINVGRALDHLQRDYPEMFNRPLDYSIYSHNIAVSDPTGVQLSGIFMYQRLFSFLRFTRMLIMEETEVRMRMHYDKAEENIKCNWNMRIWFRGNPKPFHIDGVSIYFLNSVGLIREHKVDRITSNGNRVEPPYAIQWLDLRLAMGIPRRPVSAPAFTPPPPSFYHGDPKLKPIPEHLLEAAKISASDLRNFELSLHYAGFELEQAKATPVTPAYDLKEEMPTELQAAASAAMDTTPEQDQARAVELQALRKRQDERRRKNQKKLGLFKGPSFGTGKQNPIDQCETSADCQSPKVCCDFFLFKSCCAGGIGIFSKPQEPQRSLVAIPVPVDEPEGPYGRKF